MMKWIKWILGGLASLLIVLILIIIILPFVLPLDRIKDFAAQKMGESINRQVTIENVSFNVFSGIQLNGLEISNHPQFTKKPFVSAKSIELKYDLWTLIFGKLNINKIALVKPEILIEKNSSGNFNFSDITQGKDEPKKPEGPAKKDKKDPLSFFISSFSISDAKLVYADASQKPPLNAEIQDFNLDVSGIALSTVKPMHIKASAMGIYQGEPVPMKIDSKIGLRLPDGIEVNSLDITIAGETLSLKGKISSLGDGPNIDLSLSSKKINLETFLGILSAGAQEKPKAKKASARPGELTASIDRSLKSLPAKLVLNSRIDFSNITFKGLKLDRLKLSANLKQKFLSVAIQDISAYDGKLDGKVSANLAASGIIYGVENLSLKGFNANPFWNAVVDSFLTQVEQYQGLKNKVYGKLNLSLNLKGRGVETADILKNIDARGSLKIDQAKLAKLEILEEAAGIVNLDILKQDFNLSDFSSDIILKNSRLTLDKFNANNADIKINFDGSVNLDKLLFIGGNLLKIRLEKPMAGQLGPEIDLFRNKDGSATFEFELTGSLAKPIPVPRLQKVVDKAIDQVKDQIIKKLEPQKEKLKEDAQKKLEEEAKKIFKF
jgi:uncharacterized protein involved in outer membrane biogenesis